jgi:MFS transporter, DHA1 family, inner membrane transport protein
MASWGNGGWWGKLARCIVNLRSETDAATGPKPTQSLERKTIMKRLPLAIWAMVIGAFAMGADEFIVAGVVQEIATDLQVTIGAVGLFESAYAIGVAIGAPLFTAIGSRVSRPRMLLATAVVFLIGNLVSALGPSYNIIMAGRLVSAMAHGAFLGIAAVFAADLVAPQVKGRAIATVFAGLTASTVLGAPIGAAVGRALGWRATFWSLVLMGTITLIGLIVLLPRRQQAAEDTHDSSAHGMHSSAEPGAHHNANPAKHGVSDADLAGLDAHALAHMGGAGQAAPLREQLRALGRRTVWLSLLMTLLGYGGVFTSYVYLAPQLIEVAGFDPVWVTPLFLLFGVGLFIGNTLGGRLADTYGIAAVIGTVGGLTLVLFLMTLAITNPITAVIGLLIYGIAAFAVVAPLQLQVMNQAGDAPDIASAANISAFTLGSALGIWLGGAAIDSGLGLTSVNWVGGLISLVGLVLALVTWLGRDRGQTAHSTDHQQSHVHGALSHH